MNWKKFTEINHEYEPLMIHPHSIFWSGHVDFAYDLINNFKPCIVVELGTHWGRSLFAMAQAVKDADLHDHVEMHAIDTWQGDEHTGKYNNEAYNFVNKIIKLYYSNIRIILHRKSFDEVSSQFQNKSIDLLHIDGYHTYDAVKHDFETWISKVKDDGMVLFHDVAEYKEDFGVYKLWKELSAQKENFEGFKFFHSYGLGVLFLKRGTTNEVSNDLLENALDLVDYYHFIGLNRKNCIENNISNLNIGNKKSAKAASSITSQIRILAKMIFMKLK